MPGELQVGLIPFRVPNRHWGRRLVQRLRLPLLVLPSTPAGLGHSAIPNACCSWGPSCSARPDAPSLAPPDPLKLQKRLNQIASESRRPLTHALTRLSHDPAMPSARPLQGPACSRCWACRPLNRQLDLLPACGLLPSSPARRGGLGGPWRGWQAQRPRSGPHCSDNSRPFFFFFFFPHPPEVWGGGAPLGSRFVGCRRVLVDYRGLAAEPQGRSQA